MLLRSGIKGILIMKKRNDQNSVTSVESKLYADSYKQKNFGLKKKVFLLLMMELQGNESQSNLLQKSNGTDETRLF